VIVPGEISSNIKCWGRSWENEKYWIKTADSVCSTEDEIFISPTLRTGRLMIRYIWITSNDNNPARFYNYYEKSFVDPYAYENAAERDVENFSCTADFVEFDEHDFKVSLCTRKYTKYKGIYDINLSLASVDMSNKGLLAEVVALGVGKESISSFVEKFLNGIKWQ